MGRERECGWENQQKGRIVPLRRLARGMLRDPQAHQSCCRCTESNCQVGRSLHLLKTDQCGKPRPGLGDTGVCDMGTYERQN